MSPSFHLHEITVECVDVGVVAAFWSELLGADLREPLPGWQRLDAFSGGGPMLNFQPVPEPKQGKSRIHLDLRTDDLAGAIERVVALGGRDLGERHDYDEGSVVVMADPEGHEFCLVAYTDPSGDGQ